MALCPFADIRLLPESSSQAALVATTICAHTMDGSLDGTDAYFRRSDVHVESHFGVGDDGRVFQWVDTAHTADAQVAGNAYCISIETEDRTDNTRPWTPVQLDAIVKLMAWCCDTHHIPRKQATSADRAGIGYHSLFQDWNPNAHDCPGATRLGQLRGIVIPTLQGQGQGGTDVALTDADVNAINTKVVGSLRDPNRNDGLGQIATHIDQYYTQLREDVAAVAKALANPPPPVPVTVDAAAVAAALAADTGFLDALANRAADVFEARLAQ